MIKLIIWVSKTNKKDIKVLTKIAGKNNHASDSLKATL